MSADSPRQNRVDPWGRVVATPARGLWMGNRGCLHDANGQVRRNHQVERWIICLLEFRGRRRRLMQPGRYTELFFLDEPTALAAGHRPCAECQRSRYQQFLKLWVETRPATEECTEEERGHASAGRLDVALHAARWRDGRKVTYSTRLEELPAGVMISTFDDEQPYLYWPHPDAGVVLWRWDFDGYRPRPQGDASERVRVLTPQPTVSILAAGYAVQPHPSLFERSHVSVDQEYL